MEGWSNDRKKINRASWRGTVVSLCVNVLIERDESVERETMEMQSHCTSFIQISHPAALTFSSLFFCWLNALFILQLKCSESSYFDWGSAVC